MTLRVRAAKTERLDGPAPERERHLGERLGDVAAIRGCKSKAYGVVLKRAPCAFCGQSAVSIHAAALQTAGRVRAKYWETGKNRKEVGGVDGPLAGTQKPLPGLHY